jgi:hypothetical protein
MRFFTKEMWLSWQGNSNSPNASADFTDRVNRYWEQFEASTNRIGKRAMSFFRTADLHDSSLISLSISERTASRTSLSGAPRARVELQLAPMASPRTRYVLRYERASRIEFAFPSDRPLFHSPELGIQTWGYDELSSVNAETLRHEAIFASGAVLLIEFESINCLIRKPGSARYRGT